ncbi:MAG: molybdenum cofactor biosynthesis protein MoaE [Planctomycetes bacterium]|nr:molybdenum cofactor biosynthesis protein MoaE [Planctomycetota bacterium]
MAKQQIEIQFIADAIDVGVATVLPSIGCGGECIFVGRTRPQNNEQHGELKALQYDCYEELAEKELQALAKEAIRRFGVRHIRVTHSVGRVAIHQASVVIAVASDHRDDAFTACRFMIDILKQRVPIWKQEVWSDGTTWSNGVPLIAT